MLAKKVGKENTSSSSYSITKNDLLKEDTVMKV